MGGFVCLVPPFMVSVSGDYFVQSILQQSTQTTLLEYWLCEYCVHISICSVL